MTPPYTGRVTERKPLSDADKRLLTDAANRLAAAKRVVDEAQAEYRATVVDVTGLAGDTGRAGDRAVAEFTGLSTNTITRWKREAQ